MTVAVAQVRVKTLGDETAVATGRRVADEMDRVSRNARKAEQDANRAQASQRGLLNKINDLFARARKNGNVKRSGFEWGLVELNTSGIGLNRSGVRKLPGMGAWFWGTAIAHGIGAGLNSIADARDYINELLDQKLSSEEFIRRFSAAAADKIFEYSGAKSILTGILRLGGEKQEVIDTAFQMTFDQAGYNKQYKAEMRAQKERLRQLREASARLDKALEDAEARKLEVLNQIDRQTEKEMAGIKNETLPVGLSRKHAREYRDRRIDEAAFRGQAKRDAEKRKSQLEPGQGD